MTQIICLDINDNIFGFYLLRKAIIILGYLILHIREKEEK